MVNKLLNLIGEKKIKMWLMNRVQFSEIDSQDNKILQEVFFRVPDFKKWLKQMQIRLLRNTLVDKKSAEQREGQILFIELLLAQDIPTEKFLPTKAVAEVREPIDREALINRWNGVTNQNATNSQGSKN